MLYKIQDFEIDSLTISNSKNATYLQSNKEPFELQVDWVKLGKFPLPSKKYITDDTKSITLTIPIKKNDDNYKVLSAIDANLSKLSISQHKRYHTLISEKDISGDNLANASSALGVETEHYLKFKLYLNTGLFDKDKNQISIASLFDFYKYLREDSEVKLVFGFSKIWTMNKEYGFSMSIRRVLLKGEIEVVPPESKISFLE